MYNLCIVHVCYAMYDMLCVMSACGEWHVCDVYVIRFVFMLCVMCVRFVHDVCILRIWCIVCVVSCVCCVLCDM